MERVEGGGGGVGRGGGERGQGAGSKSGRYCERETMQGDLLSALWGERRTRDFIVGPFMALFVPKYRAGV